LQHHFLNRSIYVPLEDIVVPEEAGAGPSDYGMLMQRACGRGKIFLWIPLKFTLPILGEKVIEWCWIPPTKDV
jgi:hypothetical protein